MPRLDELDLAVGAVERAEHAVDAVAGITKNLSHTPGVKAFNEKIADGLDHVRTLKIMRFPACFANV